MNIDFTRWSWLNYAIVAFLLAFGWAWGLFIAGILIAAVSRL